MKSVYSFLAYREYLKYYYSHQKDKIPGFTYASFSQRAELGSANYLKLVIDGKRNLTINNIHQFSKALGLNAMELEFFEALVLLEQSTSSAESTYYKKRISQLRTRYPRSTVYTQSQGFISKWYHPAILVGLYGPQSSNQLEAISNLTGLPLKQIAVALESLYEHGLVQKIQGIFQLGDSHLVFKNSRETKSSQRMYLAEQLQLSNRAFQNQYSTGAKFYSHTFSISKNNFDAYVAMINELIQKITSMSDEEPVEKLIQLNLQFFPLVP